MVTPPAAPDVADSIGPPGRKFPQRRKPLPQSSRSCTPAHIRAATPDDLEAMVTPPANAPIDLVAVAGQVQEALALCDARARRLDDRTSRLDERELVIDDREGSLVEREAALASEVERLRSEDRALTERQHRVEADEADQLAREASLRTRELNAEAGFVAERRHSLSQLEAEATTVREELTRARETVTTDSARDWDASRLPRRGRPTAAGRATKGARRARRDVGHRTTHVERREGGRRSPARAGSVRAQEGTGDFRGRPRGTPGGLSCLRHESRAEGRGSARGRQEPPRKTCRHDSSPHATAASSCTRSCWPTRRLSAFSATARWTRSSVSSTTSPVIENRLKADLGTRPGDDVLAKLQELERAREAWENERTRLMQELMASKTALARSSIAVTELETLRDQKAALERVLATSCSTALERAAQGRQRAHPPRRRRQPVFPPRAARWTPTARCQPRCPVTRTPLRTSPRPSLRGPPAPDRHRPEQPGQGALLRAARHPMFLGGLAMSRLHLLQGISGTGKTSLPLAVARALGRFRARRGSGRLARQTGPDRVLQRLREALRRDEFLQALYRGAVPALYRPAVSWSSSTR